MYDGQGKEFLTILNKFQKMKANSKLFELTHGEFVTLLTIENFCKKEGKETVEKGIQISALNEIMCSSKPATSKMLRNLEKKGYIVRTLAHKDKRVFYIILTEEGKRILKSTRQEMSRFHQIIIERMGEKDTEELLRLLNKMYEIMKDETEKHRNTMQERG